MKKSDVGWIMHFLTQIRITDIGCPMTAYPAVRAGYIQDRLPVYSRANREKDHLHSHLFNYKFNYRTYKFASFLNELVN